LEAENNMRRYLHLYKTFFTYSLIKNMAYPADFVIWGVIDLFWSVINIVFFKVLLLNIPTISGWTFNQLTIPLGLFSLLNAFIWGAFYGNMKNLARGVNRGDLDLILTKPVSSQFIVSTREVGLSLFPSWLTGIFILGYGFYVNRLPFLVLLLIPLILFSAVAIFYSLYFVSTTFVFWTNRLNNIAELMPNMADVAKYPTEIFPLVIRFILTFIIPLGLLAIVPAKVMLSVSSPLYLGVPVLVGIVLVYLSRRFWLFALSRYSSASS
jgi:ABC-2 type transport system permease protein